MKEKIHPTYHASAKIKCACGKEYVVGSTKEHIQVEICANCHPFYTGTEKLLDIAGKVEKFRARRAKAAETPKKTPKVRTTKQIKR